MAVPSEQGRRIPVGGLATRLILFVFAATFATSLIVSWVSIQSTYDSLRGAIDRAYPAELAEARHQVEPWLASARSELAQLAGRQDLLDGSGHPTQAFAQAVQASPHFEALAWLGPEQRIAAWVGATPTGAPALSSSSQLLMPDGSGRALLRVPLESGTLLGVLDPRPLGALLIDHHIDPHSLYALVDGGGHVLASAGALPAPDYRVSLPPRGADPERASEYSSGGRTVIGTARPVGDAGWWLVLETPFEVAFAPVLSVVSRVFVIDLAVILLFSFLAYRITGAVVRPIERLAEWTRRIAQGQFDQEIPETGSRDEIGLLTRTFNDMLRQLRNNQREFEETNRDLTEKNARLQQANEVLNQLSITDGLTKLHNHRFFQDHLTREIKRVDRAGEALSMLLIDIDDFKKLNDRFGHAAGDELLTRLAPILNTAIRETDLAARYGGEEFVILAPNTNLKGAYRLAEKVRTTIAESSFILDDSLRPMRVTVSIGVAQFAGNRKRFFQKTDEALYRAKAAGKNCVMADDERDDEDEA
jgi:diguanylate cyclase (GGDEF)-like protein